MISGLLLDTFIIAMILYGAWVAPKLRVAVAVAVVVILACSLVWRALGSRRRRRES